MSDQRRQEHNAPATYIPGSMPVRDIGRWYRGRGAGTRRLLLVGRLLGHLPAARVPESGRGQVPAQHRRHLQGAIQREGARVPGRRGAGPEF